MNIETIIAYLCIHSVVGSILAIIHAYFQGHNYSNAPGKNDPNDTILIVLFWFVLFPASLVIFIANKSFKLGKKHGAGL